MKKRICSVVLSVILSTVALISIAYGSVEEVLTLDQCIAVALEHNPLVLSSREQYRASLARIHQARALFMPSLDFDSDLQPSFFNFGDSAESYVGLSLPLEFPGKRQVRGKIAAKESQELLAEIDLLKLDITLQVKQAFYGLLLAQEKIKYAEQNLELAKDFLDKAELKFTAGDVARVEVLRARVEASKAANETRIAKNEEKLARAMLNFLLARKKYEPLAITGELKKQPLILELEGLKGRAFAFRPEIKRLSHALDRESLIRTQGYMSYLPDFDIGLSRHRLQGEKTTWDFTLSFPIPLFFWQPKKGEIAEASANIEALKRDQQHLQNTIGLEVEEAYLNAVTAENQIELFEKEILTQAEEVYKMFLFSYQEGEISGIELIEARRTLIEARRSYADALFNYDITLAVLEKSIGQNLEGEQK